MPKSKVNRSSIPTTGSVNRTPVKINSSGTPMWYKVLMFGFMLLGLMWLVVNYLAGPSIPFMAELAQWNYAIGFAFLIVGLLMTMGWR
ncbi:cell division protein CrgA [Corynebacterium choanae]|uniref:Cell division protein CrgA n=1 Tax=Corynebacterium choanae TaxID=1862358 RepID=A0A3G6J6B9_9CORY|nr:cell division protein CrgA [Corynebacterium choanae]AZA12468.1 Cell division protein CrgA [Corynebacterium choanae]